MNFTYHRPKSLEQALSLLQRYGDKAAILAGGTDLLVELKRGLRHPAHVIDVKEVRELAMPGEDRQRRTPSQPANDSPKLELGRCSSGWLESIGASGIQDRFLAG